MLAPPSLGPASRTERESLVVDLLHDATLTVRARLKSELEPLGLTPCQFWLLHRIVEERSTTATRLATLEGLAPGTVSVTVDRLVREGLVRRSPAARDRRVVALAASARGHARVEGVWRRLGTIFSEAGRDVPPSDFAAMIRVLRALRGESKGGRAPPAGRTP